MSCSRRDFLKQGLGSTLVSALPLSAFTFLSNSDARAAVASANTKWGFLVDTTKCVGCGFCVEYCPKDVLVLSEGFNRKGYHPPEVVKQGECVNCNLCEMICPDFAIFCVPAEEEAVADEGGPN